MNNLRSSIKVILSIMGIFFAIRLLPPVTYSISALISGVSSESLVPVLFSIVVTGVCIIATYYFFFYKREYLAQKILGKEELQETDLQTSWLPAAFRLICVFVGLYSLLNFFWRLTFFIQRYFLFRARDFYTSSPVSLDTLLSLTISLAIGIYLLCGAPHFVKWQVKKTLEQCKKTIEK